MARRKKGNKKFQGLKKPNKSQNAGGGSLGKAPAAKGQQTGKRSPFGMSKGTRRRR